MGTTLDTLRSTPHPDGRAASRIMCSGDAEAKGGMFNRLMTDDPTKQIIKCAYYEKGYWGRFDGVSPVKVGSRDSTHDAYFWAIKDPTDGAMKVYKIEFTAAVEFANDIATGLTKKFGKPQGVNNETVRNGLGATFPRKVYIWNNAVAGVQFESPSQTIDELVVTYIDKRLAAHVTRLLHPAAGRPESQL